MGRVFFGAHLFDKVFQFCNRGLQKIHICQQLARSLLLQSRRTYLLAMPYEGQSVEIQDRNVEMSRNGQRDQPSKPIFLEVDSQVFQERVEQTVSCSHIGMVRQKISFVHVATKAGIYEVVVTVVSARRDRNVVIYR
jgi:hypothetical protein